jgi:glycosyltransferase involved in cell wall biosynthesis
MTTPPPTSAASPHPRGEELLYVLIPCLNEAEAVGTTVASVLCHTPRLPVAVRILLIDDGSTDGTRQRMEQLATDHTECSVIVNESTLGLGRSVLRAYDRLPEGCWVTVLPGDNELVFESIDNYMAVRDRYDVILGYLQNPVVRTLGRRLASFAFTKVINTLYGFPWRYVNGLKMYRLDAFKGIEAVSSGHAFMAELLAKAQLRDPRLRITEVPFVARGRARGESKAIRPGSVLKAVREVFRGVRAVSRYRDQVVRGTPGAAIS